MLTYFTLPAATTTLYEMSLVGQPFFDEIWPWARFGLAIVAVGAIIGLLFWAFGRLMGR